ncbi:MAG: cyclase [Bauldia sp.]|nr:cyclase [Bauldia sp.]
MLSQNAGSAASEVLAVASHAVADYPAWRAVYDAGRDLRERMGVTGGEVFVDPQDPNRVLVLTRFASLAAMEAFRNDADLAEAMKRGGVVQPRMILVGVRP